MSAKDVHYIMRLSSSLRLWWDIVVILLAIYNSFTIPLSLAFNPPDLSSTGILCLDTFVDLAFFVDIIINFRTTYISQTTGNEVYNPKLIAKNYVLGGRFWIDLLSSLPMDIFGS
jgi:potassium voltage-gated channel Eag-related subfamily H protein 4